jgi:DNA-binding NarL/FixJ family response regulator
VLAYTDRPLIAEGLIEMLPAALREQTIAVAEIDSVTVALALHVHAAVIDLGTRGAAEAVQLVREAGASATLLAPGDGATIDQALAEQADAILLRDEVEARTLRMALVAASLGVRVVARDLRVYSAVASGQGAPQSSSLAFGEPAQRALTLLAEGMRDAEIARELHLSESATRKLIQRAVRRIGARTRAQAVAAAVRGGELK